MLKLNDCLMYMNYERSDRTKGKKIKVYTIKKIYTNGNTIIIKNTNFDVYQDAVTELVNSVRKMNTRNTIIA